MIVITNMRYWRIVSVVAVLLLAFQARSQSNYPDALSKLEQEYQQCQSKSNNLLGCSQQYYQQLEGLLQAVQKDAGASLKANQKAAFKSAQSAWNQKKTTYFRELPASIKADNEDLAGPELQAAIIDKKAEFLVERINELMGGVDTGGEE